MILFFNFLILAILVTLIVLLIIRKNRHVSEIEKKDWYIDTLHGKIKKMKAENKNAKENIKTLENKLIGFNDTEICEQVSFEEGMKKNHG